jgi:hypothetical protein
MLASMKQHVKHPDFILIAGALCRHIPSCVCVCVCVLTPLSGDYVAHHLAFCNDTIPVATVVLSKVRRMFPDAILLGCLGNNDVCPKNKHRFSLAPLLSVHISLFSPPSPRPAPTGSRSGMICFARTLTSPHPTHRGTTFSPEGIIAGTPQVGGVFVSVCISPCSRMQEHLTSFYRRHSSGGDV